MAKKSQAPSTKRLNPKLKPKEQKSGFIEALKEYGPISFIGAGAFGVLLSFLLASDDKRAFDTVQKEKAEQAILDVPKTEPGISWPVVYDTPVKVEAKPEVTVPLKAETDPIVVKTVIVPAPKVYTEAPVIKPVVKKKPKPVIKAKPTRRRKPVDLDTNQITLNNLRGIPNY